MVLRQELEQVLLAIFSVPIAFCFHAASASWRSQHVVLVHIGVLLALTTLLEEVPVLFPKRWVQAPIFILRHIGHELLSHLLSFLALLLTVFLWNPYQVSSGSCSHGFIFFLDLVVHVVDHLLQEGVKGRGHSLPLLLLHILVVGLPQVYSQAVLATLGQHLSLTNLMAIQPPH